MSEFRIQVGVDAEIGRTWLVRAKAIPTLERIVLRSWIGEFGFTRDADRAFTRLDLEVRPNDPVARLEDVHWRNLVDTVKMLPEKSLTHFTAKAFAGGKLLPLPELDAVGNTKLR